jgi:hypothetical protein
MPSAVPCGGVRQGPILAAIYDPGGTRAGGSGAKLSPGKGSRNHVVPRPPLKSCSPPLPGAQLWNEARHR